MKPSIDQDRVSFIADHIRRELEGFQKIDLTDDQVVEVFEGTGFYASASFSYNYEVKRQEIDRKLKQDFSLSLIFEIKNKLKAFIKKRLSSC